MPFVPITCPKNLTLSLKKLHLEVLIFIPWSANVWSTFPTNSKCASNVLLMIRTSSMYTITFLKQTSLRIPYRVV